MKSMDERLKSAHHENHELRLKVNKLLEERQAQLVKMERYRVCEWDLMRQYDLEHKKRLDTDIRARAIEKKSKELAVLLDRQIKLKEMFEDKMKIALDLEMFGDK